MCLERLAFQSFRILGLLSPHKRHQPQDRRWAFKSDSIGWPVTQTSGALSSSYVNGYDHDFEFECAEDCVFLLLE